MNGYVCLAICIQYRIVCRMIATQSEYSNQLNETILHLVANSNANYTGTKYKLNAHRSSQYRTILLKNHQQQKSTHVQWSGYFLFLVTPRCVNTRKMRIKSEPWY